MITVEKIRIFKKWDGDDDMLSRAGSEAERRAFDPDDWSHIRELVQRLSLINATPVADSYKAETSDLISAWISDQAALKEIDALAQ
jgi:hypothetical protein